MNRIEEGVSDGESENKNSTGQVKTLKKDKTDMSRP
jgi:hypothetical protein